MGADGTRLKSCSCPGGCVPRYLVYVTRIHLLSRGTPLCPECDVPLVSEWQPEQVEAAGEAFRAAKLERQLASESVGTSMRADTYVLLDDEQDGQTCATCSTLHHAGDLMISSQASIKGLGMVNGYYCAQGEKRDHCTGGDGMADREIPGGYLTGCRALGLQYQPDNSGASNRRQRADWRAERARLDETVPF